MLPSQLDDPKPKPMPPGPPSSATAKAIAAIIVEAIFQDCGGPQTVTLDRQTLATLLERTIVVAESRTV